MLGIVIFIRLNNLEIKILICYLPTISLLITDWYNKIKQFVLIILLKNYLIIVSVVFLQVVFYFE